MLQDVWLSCVDPPESGLQGLVCRVQPRVVRVSAAGQELLHLVFITEDIPKKQNKNIFTKKNLDFDVDNLVYLKGSDETE